MKMRPSLAALGAVVLFIGCRHEHIEPRVSYNCVRVAYDGGMERRVAAARAVDRLSENHVIAHDVRSINNQPYTARPELDITSSNIAIEEGACY